MTKTLLEVFNKIFSHVKFNQELAKNIYRFQVGFVNKNNEHMEFFGGNLLGVHVVRFTERDTTTFFNDVLDVDYLEIAEAIKEVDAINPEFKVSSDTLNLTCMYVIHRFLTTPSLDEARRTRAASDTALIFNYRCFTALLAHYFRYPVDPKTAQAVYMSLSQRFLIKKLGSWQEVFSYRATEFISKDGIWYTVLSTFTDDYGVVRAINDGQGRIRDMMKNITAEFKRVHGNGEKIGTTSNTIVDIDGNEVIRDRVHGPEMYMNYLISVLPDKNSFIKEELVSVIVKIVESIQSRNFKLTLEWFSKHSNDEHRALVDNFVKMTLIYSIEYLSKHGYLLRNSKDLVGIMSKLKGLYLSSRSTDDNLTQIRDDGRTIVRLACGHISEQAGASVRTGLILYICLRAFTKHYYTK